MSAEERRARSKFPWSGGVREEKLSGEALGEEKIAETPEGGRAKRNRAEGKAR